MIRDNFLGVTVHCHHKGGNSQQEMNNANQLENQRNQLMQQQLQMQQQQLNLANPTLQQIIQNGGMLPQQEAALRSQAMAMTGQTEQNVLGQLNQSLVARGITGGQNAGSGAIASQYGSLGAQLAGQQAGLEQQLQGMKMQGLQGALGTTLGEAGMFGSQATGFGGQGVNALGIGQQAANAADQASTGFWGSVIGGLTGMVNPIKIPGLGCWVAAELYNGWFAPETCSIRNWLWSTWYMRPFCSFYLRFGQRWANLIRRYRLIRYPTKKLFDVFLRLSRG